MGLPKNTECFHRPFSDARMLVPPVLARMGGGAGIGAVEWGRLVNRIALRAFDRYDARTQDPWGASLLMGAGGRDASS
jgi:hypothetical protein